MLSLLFIWSSSRSQEAKVINKISLELIFNKIHTIHTANALKNQRWDVAIELRYLATRVETDTYTMTTVTLCGARAKD